jgi:NTE family protein
MTEFKLSFSGGGLRATFFCLGAYRRLVELGIDDKVKLISSVSGGSITAGVIMQALIDGPFVDTNDFDRRVTTVLKRFGRENFRASLLRRSIRFNLRPELPRTRFSRMFPELLDDYLFNGLMLEDLPEKPLWICNATNLQTLKRFSFSRTQMCDERLGKCRNINGISTAEAVAASSAFPMMFEPVKLDVKKREFDGIEDQYSTLHLTDGGVYDNLGSEEMLERSAPYIILDASARYKPWETSFKPSYAGRQSRIMNVSLDQVAELRKKLIRKDHSRGVQLINVETINENAAFQMNYWNSRGSTINIPAYPSLYADIERMLAGLRTDLDQFHDIEMAMLMWAGAMRLDLGVKVLFSEEEMPLLKPRKSVPLLADYTVESISKIKRVLQKGQRRKILRGFFPDDTNKKRTKVLKKPS